MIKIKNVENANYKGYNVSNSQINNIGTSLLNGGYLPSPGVALADAEIMSAST